MGNTVKASITNAKVHADSVQVQALERASIYNIAVGLAGGAGVAISGSVAVSTIENTVKAVISGSDVTANAGDIVISALDVASIASLAGNVSVSVGGRVAAGLAFAVNQVFDTVYAQAVGSSLSASGDILVSAKFAEPDDMPPGLNAQISSMAVSGAVAVAGSGANIAVGGSAVLNWVATDIKAEIANVAATDVIKAQGDIMAQAGEHSTLERL